MQLVRNPRNVPPQPDAGSNRQSFAAKLRSVNRREVLADGGTPRVYTKIM